MAFGSFEGKGSGSHAVSEINMVPLIDVMLVLLVIFIITAPLLAHSIKINMPQVAAEQIQEIMAVNAVKLVYEGKEMGSLDLVTVSAVERSETKYYAQVVEETVAHWWVKGLIIAVLVLILIVIVMIWVFVSHRRRERSRYRRYSYSGKRRRY